MPAEDDWKWIGACVAVESLPSPNPGTVTSTAPAKKLSITNMPTREIVVVHIQLAASLLSFAFRERMLFMTVLRLEFSFSLLLTLTVHMTAAIPT
jgi:hypothetical protein